MFDKKYYSSQTNRFPLIKKLSISHINNLFTNNWKSINKNKLQSSVLVEFLNLYNNELDYIFMRKLILIFCNQQCFDKLLSQKYDILKTLNSTLLLNIFKKLNTNNNNKSIHFIKNRIKTIVQHFHVNYLEEIESEKEDDDDNKNEDETDDEKMMKKIIKKMKLIQIKMLIQILLK